MLLVSKTINLAFYYENYLRKCLTEKKEQYIYVSVYVYIHGEHVHVRTLIIRGDMYYERHACFKESDIPSKM